jgi:hypothetical protein
MNTQTNAVAIPVLGAPVAVSSAMQSPGFAAFKAEERISFIRQYSPQVTEIEGMRHAVIRYRNTDGKSTKTAQMVTVPQIAFPEEYQLLPEKALQVLRGVFEDEQDNIIRAKIDAQATYIHWDSLTLDEVLTSLTAIRMSQRLTKEQIEQWAKIALLEACEKRARQICEAKSITGPEVNKQIAGTLNAYVSCMMKLAAPVPNLGEQEARAALNMLKLAQLGDDMAKVLMTKLDAILNPKVVENMDL